MQPMQAVTISKNKWSTGLCEICHIDTRLQTVFCIFGFPCISYGQLADKNEFGGFCGGCLLGYTSCCWTCIWAGDNRRHLRKKYNLEEAPCSDCCVHFWCWPCATCQELRQLNEPLPGAFAKQEQQPVNLSVAHSNQVMPH